MVLGMWKRRAEEIVSEDLLGSVRCPETSPIDVDGSFDVSLRCLSLVGHSDYHLVAKDGEYFRWIGYVNNARTPVASESSPSQVKPSETGATAEEQAAREIEVQSVALVMEIAKALALHLPDDFPQIETKRRLRAMVQPFLTRLVTAAKREGAIEAEAALRKIAEGNLGDAPWQANYDRIREVARDALSALREQGGGR